LSTVNKSPAAMALRGFFLGRPGYTHARGQTTNFEENGFKRLMGKRLKLYF